MFSKLFIASIFTKLKTQRKNSTEAFFIVCFPNLKSYKELNLVVALGNWPWDSTSCLDHSIHLLTDKLLERSAYHGVFKSRHSSQSILTQTSAPFQFHKCSGVDNNSYGLSSSNLFHSTCPVTSKWWVSCICKTPLSISQKLTPWREATIEMKGWLDAYCETNFTYINLQFTF